MSKVTPLILMRRHSFVLKQLTQLTEWIDDKTDYADGALQYTVADTEQFTIHPNRHHTEYLYCDEITFSVYGTPIDVYVAFNVVNDYPYFFTEAGAAPDVLPMRMYDSERGRYSELQKVIETARQKRLEAQQSTASQAWIDPARQLPDKNQPVIGMRQDGWFDRFTFDPNRPWFRHGMTQNIRWWQPISLPPGVGSLK